jgi:DNA-3-methyladenine glycosylase II
VASALETVRAVRNDAPALSLTADDYVRARRLLLRRDPVLAVVIRKIGPCGLAGRQNPDHLGTLVRAIVGQQLSVKAAATIYARLVALFAGGVVTVDGLAAVEETRLRTVGLSRQKVTYLRDLCARIHGRELELEQLARAPDEQVIARLTAVKGFGRWTAEMFLMFHLHRPDVLPVGDLGISRAVERLYRLRTRPTPERLLTIGEPWRPYRSVACWYLWQSLKNEP